MTKEELVSEMAAMSEAKGFGTFGSLPSSNERLAELIIAIAGPNTDDQLDFLAFAAFVPGIAEMLVEIVEAAGDMEIKAVEIF